MHDTLARGGDGGFVLHDLSPSTDDFLEAALQGLAGTPKAIPCRFLYDQRGSQLFDAICDQPEYYPTRTELDVLSANAGEIAAMIGPCAQLVELGSGSSRKVRLLLEAMDRPCAYVAIDISKDHLVAAAGRVAWDNPGLAVHAVCADYGRPLTLPPLDSAVRRVAFFPGSTIGNFEPAAAQAFLAAWARRLGPGAGMLIGVDLRKAAAILDAAYDDAAGVTALFSANLLVRANRELGADFQVERFRHEARYDPRDGRVEIVLRSLAAQTVHLAGRSFSFDEGEPLHVENSYKYDIEGFADLARGAGFASGESWTDARRLFSVHYLTVPDAVPRAG